MAAEHDDTPIETVCARAYKVPTDAPEADGTLSWDSTTLVLVRVGAGGVEGLGYTYAHSSLTALIEDKLGSVVHGRDAMDVPAAWQGMLRAVRNLGRPGLVACAISAVDAALWDLKARLLGLPLCRLLGMTRGEVPIYGSGGFTSYSIERLQEQLGGWAAAGIPRVKMKVGSDPGRDEQRVRAAREAIGPEVELFVDANGAYTRKQALSFAERFAHYGVQWFEEPVSSDDLAGLRLLRDRGPAGMAIAAGEYGYDAFYFRRMVQAGAVDVLQADATRCLGLTGFLHADALCQSHALPLSAHTAPAQHLHACCAVQSLQHIEYFHDHVRIEQEFFEGAPRHDGGVIRPNLGRPGNGLALREDVARRYAV